MPVPYVFSTLPNGTNIPLSYLDANFAYLINNTPSFQMDNLLVTALNTVSPLSRIPNMQLFLMIVNGSVFAPVGASPPFTVSGDQITWSSSLYDLNLGDSVVAVYTY